MADANWQKVREVFDTALQKQPKERRSYIKEACGDDTALLTEVQSLVSSLDQSNEFLEIPAVAHVAEMIVTATQSRPPGTRFGHYELIRQIGIGGTGEVYLARDQKLDRLVGIKILNEDFRREDTNLERFAREAKAASALNHPNILVIHEVGESEAAHYIVSEFIEGRTLRELAQSQISLKEIVGISIQIANALSAAHEAHLIHRDIKPENVMVRPDGYVKVLDFGLAKLVRQEDNALIGLGAATGNQTAKGEPVDQRTDIFSFGVVLYEMLAGRVPFAGDSLSETFANLINAEPLSLSNSVSNVPDELTRIVAKTLRKNKDERYQSMKDVLRDLEDLRVNLTLENRLERSVGPGREKATASLLATTENATKQARTKRRLSLTVRRYKRLSAFTVAALIIGVVALAYYFFYWTKPASGVSGMTSIAILPLRPIDTSNRDKFFEIGVADSLINRISSMDGVKVRRLSATRKYADIEQDPIVAGREQQVDYVLASTYQLADGKLRITAQLFNVATGQIVAAHPIVKEASNLFAMQDEIAGEIGNSLLQRFVTSPRNTVIKRGTENEEAYRKYLQGIYLYDKRTLADAQKAVGFFEEAIELDQRYALAWAGKALVHRALGNFGGDPHVEYEKSMEAINHALALDQNLADAHSALCENKFFYEWDLDGAERECRLAIELDVNSARAHDMYSRYLYGSGRFAQAIAESKTAIDLEPTALFIQRNYGISLFYARRYKEAITQFKRVLEIDPNFVATYAWLVPALNVQGNEAEAFEWFIKWQAVLKTDDETVQRYTAAYKKAGWEGIGRERVKRFDESRIRSYFLEACLTVHTGDKDKAIEYLEKSYQRREWGMSHLQVDPSLDGLGTDPRFRELVRRVALN